MGPRTPLEFLLCLDETTEKITWLNGTAEISMEDIKAKQTELQTKVNNGEDIIEPNIELPNELKFNEDGTTHEKKSK